MGCDIHAWGEKQLPTTEWILVELKPEPFDWRSYGLFGFLADVRNYSDVPPISAARGVPDTLSKEAAHCIESWDADAHSHSWLTVAELEAFDYEKPVEDRRITVNGNGGCTAEPGGGRMTTYREFLNTGYFDELKRLKEAGIERIVFCFDN